MSNKYSDAAWSIVCDIHSKDHHQWDEEKMNYYKKSNSYPWLDRELDLIEKTLSCLGLSEVVEPKKWVEERKSNMYKETLAQIDLDKFNFEGRCKQLEIENKRLTDCLKNIHKSVHKDPFDIARVFYKAEQALKGE
jgi:hypothetical protein